MLSLPLRTKFDKREWFIGQTHISVAERMVTQFHYSHGASPNAVYAHGLFLRGDFNCWGVAWWIPAQKGTIDKYNPRGFSTTLTLHRLVIHPLVPTNGASFLLGASIRTIERDGKYQLLITYADTWRGHTGAIYKATNWDYRGLTNPLPIWVDQNGRQRSSSSRLLSGNERQKSPSAKEKREMGYSLVGRFPKHVYTMELKTKPQSVQFPLWAAA